MGRENQVNKQGIKEHSEMGQNKQTVVIVVSSTAEEKFHEL